MEPGPGTMTQPGSACWLLSCDAEEEEEEEACGHSSSQSQHVSVVQYNMDLGGTNWGLDGLQKWDDLFVFPASPLRCFKLSNVRYETEREI